MSDELTYDSYLRIPQLLSLQQCRSTDPDTGEPEHDETLFIVIHQVYELWFKQVLHELDELYRHLDADEPSRGTHQLKRVLKILKTLVTAHSLTRSGPLDSTPNPSRWAGPAACGLT